MQIRLYMYAVLKHYQLLSLVDVHGANEISNQLKIS